GRGLDQAVAARAERLARGLDDQVVGNGVFQLVAARSVAEINVEHEIELETLSDLALMRHHAVIGVQSQAVDEDRITHWAALGARLTGARLIAVSLIELA